MSTDKKTKVPILLFGILLIITILLLTSRFSLTAKSILNKPLSVYDVWSNAKILDGKKIHVQGKAVFSIWLIGEGACCSQACNCGERLGFLELVSDSPIRINKKHSSTDYISIYLPSCDGDYCSLTCSPFDPTKAEAFEFYGVLEASYRNDDVTGLLLKDIDFSVSKQLIDGEWRAIETGKFEIPMTVPTPPPGACD